METFWLFSVAVILIARSTAAPLDKVEVTAIHHDDIEELNDGSLVYTDRGTVIVGDMELDLNRNGILSASHHWPNGQIFYTISSNYSSTVHDMIIAAMRELEHDINGAGSCIHFIQRTNQPNYIEVHAGTGCHSIVGYNHNGRQEVSIGAGCELKGIIMHELIHTIGFWHEHNRPDRDTYIDINLNNVKLESRHDFNLRTAAEATTLRTTYDFESIMHYGTYTFAVDRSVPVITPKPGRATSSTALGQRLSLSTTDVLKIQRLYGCPEDTSHITKPTALTKCTFENSMCSMLTETTPAFSWTYNKGTSPAGPHAGNSYGTDTYLVVHQSPSHTAGVARFHTATYNNGPVCVDFFLYQKGPSSYLELVAKGPHLTTTVLKSYHNNNHDSWYHTRTSVNIQRGTDFTITFQAHMAAGDIAIDDLIIYEGHCV